MSYQTAGYPLSTIVLASHISDTPAVNTAEFVALPSTRATFGTTESARQTIIPIGMTISRFFVEHSNAQAVSTNPLNVRLDGVNTGLTVSIPTGTAGFTTDLINSFHADAGQLLSISSLSPVGSTAAIILSASVIGVLDG